jgi:hypothetical protein
MYEIANGENTGTRRPQRRIDLRPKRTVVEINPTKANQLVVRDPIAS